MSWCYFIYFYFMYLAGVFGGGGKKLEKRVFSRRRRLRENFLCTFFRNVSTNNTPKITFFEFFGKFVKNAIKSDFWGVVGRYNFTKISKKVLKNFQISKKVLKNFSRRLRCRENPFFQFCAPG